MTKVTRRGTTLPYTNGTGSTIAANTPVLVGKIIGFAIADIANGATGDLEIGPMTEIEVTAATGAWTQGADIFWSAGNSNFTTTASGNTLVGVASRSKATAATTGYIIPNVHS